MARRARDRRLVQIELVGDLAQSQRAHRQVTVLEEILLPRHDGFRDALDRQEALLQVAHQPTRFLQMLREQCRLTITRLAEVVRILLVYPDAWIDGRIHSYCPTLLLLADDHVRYDRPRLKAPDLRA